MEKLIRFLKRLFSENLYGTITIKFENGKVPYIETTSIRKWQFEIFSFSCYNEHYLNLKN